MVLHIVSTSPFASQTLSQCLNRMTKQDGLLLIQDGVYALTDQRLHQQLAGIEKLYVLNEDIQARGLGSGTLSVEIIDYAAFVTLTLVYEHSLSW